MQVCTCACVIHSYQVNDYENQCVNKYCSNEEIRCQKYHNHLNKSVTQHEILVTKCKTVISV